MYALSKQKQWEAKVKVKETDPTSSQILFFSVNKSVLTILRAEEEAEELQLSYLNIGDQFSHSVVSNSLQSHGLQHARPPCPSPSPRAYSNSCPSSQWYHHQLPGFTQTHVHWFGDAIQPSHPLLSLSPSAFNLSQHQGLCQWVSSSQKLTKVLEFQL